LRGNEVDGYKTLIYEKFNGIGSITLNRPDFLNVYNIQMRDELYEVLGAINEDQEIKVVIFKGAGEKAFCAGADLSEFLTAPSPVVARQVRFGRDIWKVFLSLQVPLIAALHGFVLGSGIEIALCCDIRIASMDVRFGLPEPALGIIPAAGATQTLPRVIGRVNSLEMLFTNRWLNGDEALRVGLVNKIVPKSELIEAAFDMAKKIASYPQFTVRKAKEAILRGIDLTLPQALELERRLFLEVLWAKKGGYGKE